MIALVSLSIALMSWFSVRPTNVGTAIQKILPFGYFFGIIAMSLGIIVMFIGTVIIGVRVIQEFKKDNVPRGRLVSLAITIFCFLWSLILLLSVLPYWEAAKSRLMLIR